MASKIKICNSLNEIKEILKQNSNAYFCLYLAYKTDADWEKSTSRVYMNQLHSNFIYLPVNIEKEDHKFIEEVYRFSEENNQIVAINQTQPHKSNPVLKEWFKGKDIPTNVDCLVKDSYGKLQCFDLNGPSFVGWFTDEVDTFENRVVIILGVGGAGEPIARRISKEKPKQLTLVDPLPKYRLVTELSSQSSISYSNSLEFLELTSKKELIFINCAGKEGSDDSSCQKFLSQYENTSSIFIDLRPHLNIESVELAKKLNWNAYTGYGMNARNDYSLLQEILNKINLSSITFEKFKELVKNAS